MNTASSFKRILLATDGSEQAMAAVDAAIALAKVHSAAVRVVHVWNLEVHHRHGFWDVEVRSEAQHLVDATVERIRAAGVQAYGEIDRADGKHVAGALAGSAREFNADLVIVGSRGLSEWQSMTKHSVSHELLCALDCPILVVRSRPASATDASSRVLLTIAGEDDIAPAVRAATAAAAAPGSKVLVVHVAQTIVGAQGFAYVEPEDEVRATMARTIKLLEDAGVSATGMVAQSGPVAEIVAQIASNWHADLIVTGSSRMPDLASMVLGSVSHDLLHIADRPVLVAERVR